MQPGHSNAKHNGCDHPRTWVCGIGQSGVIGLRHRKFAFQRLDAAGNDRNSSKRHESTGIVHSRTIHGIGCGPFDLNVSNRFPAAEAAGSGEWAPQTLDARDYWEATSSRRARLSGYLRTRTTKAAAWRFGWHAPVPLFQCSFVHAHFACKHRSRATQPFSSLPDQLGIHLGKRSDIHLVTAECEFALPVILHRAHAFHQLAKNISPRHHRIAPGALRWADHRTGATRKEHVGI
jgi:hypothetical protein